MKAFTCFKRQCLLFAILYWVACGSALAHSNTENLSISEADNIFLKKNLYVLAAQLNVSAQKAGEIQARTYPNPLFSAELNAVDPQNDQIFHIGQTGEKAFGIEQTILLGGKRKKEIELAKQNTALASLMLEDLLRNLRQRLHSSMYSIHFDERTLVKYNTQLQLLDSIIDGYEVQAAKGNVSLKEVVRLKTIYLQLNNDKTELLHDMQEEQKNLQILLGTTDFITPQVDPEEWEKFKKLPALDALLALAEDNRPDWKMAEINKQSAALNLRYQRSLAVPDLILGAVYDQRGGAFINQVNMNLGIPLPLWNRNQGNIRAARIRQDISDVQKQTAEKEIDAEVTAAWYNMKRSIQEYDKLKQLYNSDFNDVFQGVTTNFIKRNLSFLEFVDFFEAYNQSLAETNRIRKQVALSAEEINYATGYPVYK